MKASTIILKLVFTFLLFNVLLYASFSSQMRLSFFDKGFKKYSVYELFSKDEALARAGNIIDFFDSKSDLTYFKEDEQSHLRDVKIIMDGFRLLFFISLNLLVLFFFLNKNIPDYLFFSSVFLLIFMAIAVLFAYLQFDLIFQKFHELFFAGNYSFDPSVSEMKALFPDGFFLHFTAQIILKVMIICTFLTYLSKNLLIKKVVH